MYFMKNVNQLKVIKILNKLGVFTYGEVIKAGISRFTIKSMLKKNELQKLEHGLYVYKNNPNINPEYFKLILLKPLFYV